MKRLTFVFAFSLLVMVAVSAPVFAEDTVYLKDGSIIHGNITEEFPGKSLKIETKDGNVFVYKMKAIERITHSAAAAQTDEQADESQIQEGEDQQEEAAPAPPVHKKKKAYNATNYNNAPAAPANNPNARFNKFGFLFSMGGWNPGVYADVNADIDLIDSSYEFYPG